MAFELVGRQRACGARRKRGVARIECGAARRAIVLLARRHTTMSFQEIARRLGRRTHSGVYQMHLAAHGTHNEAWLSLLERATELARVRADAVRISQEERS